MEAIDNSDENIAAAVQQGNVDAFGDLVVRYEDKLKRYGRKFLSQKEDIEDLVQEVFIKAYVNIQSFDTSLRFSPWVYRIAHNVFVNELKRKSHYSFDIFNADAILPFVAAKETTDSSLLAEEAKAEMETLLSTLSVKHREVLVLYYFQELSYKEISDILQIPISTVGVRITRARAALKNIRQHE